MELQYKGLRILSRYCSCQDSKFRSALETSSVDIDKLYLPIYLSILGYLSRHSVVRCSTLWSIFINIYLDSRRHGRDSEIRSSLGLLLSIYLSIYISVYLSVYLSFCLSIHPFIYLSIHLPVSMSVSSGASLQYSQVPSSWMTSTHPVTSHLYSVHLSPVHLSPVHLSPVHLSPVHLSPVHLSPVTPITCTPITCTTITCTPITCTPITCTPRIGSAKPMLEDQSHTNTHTPKRMSLDHDTQFNIILPYNYICHVDYFLIINLCYKHNYA